ncbi:unnamed protein product [Rhizoctonia solani]|uniref:Fe2OG dioxygenase domain-containing protein n=1 Tax=Rhizoctonia solani TaxID=456999 RepID=A0A8H3DFM7_9AGAM|nr:unnamed protein product [Rhizoctonia solani]
MPPIIPSWTSLTLTQPEHLTMTTVDHLALAAQPTRPFESVPVIDISGLFGDANSRAQVADAIRDACIHVGFFYVKNHGIDEALIASTVDAARRFFELPLEEKMELDYRKTPNRGGYFPVAQKGSVHECFELETGINTTSNITMVQTNIWPSQDLAPGFQEVVLKYYKALSELSFKISSAFALALNLPDNYFDDKVQTLPAMRLMHYPPQAEVIDNRNSGTGSHTDFQFFTMLWQDEVPALQLRNTLGQWVNADPIPVLEINCRDGQVIPFHLSDFDIY